MSMTSTRMREARRRRARREVQLTIVLHEHDLAEIAKRGYQSAAPTGEAVSLFVSDTLWG